MTGDLDVPEFDYDAGGKSQGGRPRWTTVMTAMRLPTSSPASARPLRRSAAAAPLRDDDYDQIDEAIADLEEQRDFSAVGLGRRRQAPPRQPCGRRSRGAALCWMTTTILAQASMCRMPLLPHRAQLRPLLSDGCRPWRAGAAGRHWRVCADAPAAAARSRPPLRPLFSRPIRPGESRAGNAWRQGCSQSGYRRIRQSGGQQACGGRADGTGFENRNAGRSGWKTAPRVVLPGPAKTDPALQEESRKQRRLRRKPAKSEERVAEQPAEDASLVKTRSRQRFAEKSPHHGGQV